MTLLPPCPLSKEHMVDDFECGQPQLDIWLKRYAWQNQRAEAARTFVVCDERRVVGFYSLAVGKKSARQKKSFLKSIFDFFLPL
jgi:hypothetical protein